MKSRASKWYRIFGFLAALTGFLLIYQNCSSSNFDTPAASASNNGSGASKTANRILISGIPAAHGIFDASIAQDPSSNKIWMSYSAVNASTMWPSQNYDVVSTRLAYSTDLGLTWVDSGSAINSPVDVTLALAAPFNAGTWHNEVSSLVYDGGAPASQRWKLMWHHYLLINGARHFEHGWLALKMAASPEMLSAASEVKLFSGSMYDVGNNVLGGGSASPLGGAPAIALDLALNSQLNNCAIFTEAGMLANASGLYLNLLCGTSTTNHRIILLKCAAPCNPSLGASWSFLGVALNDADAASFGFNQGFSGASLVSANGSYYLLATPVKNTPMDGFYNGCMLFKFDNLEAASLQRSSGALSNILSVNGDAGSFNGACTYWPAASKAGIIYSQAVSDFRLFSTGITF